MVDGIAVSAGRLLRGAAALLLSIAATLASAGTCTTCSTVMSGQWNDPDVWGGSAPAGSGVRATINTGHTITATNDVALTTLTIAAGGKLQGVVGSPYTFTMVSGSAALSIDGTLDLQAQSGGVTVATGYLVLGAGADFSGSGTLNLFNFDLGGRALTFIGSPTATFRFGAATPIVNGTITAPAGTRWEFNALGNQTIPTTGFTWGHLATSGSGTKTIASGTLVYNGNLSIGAGTTLSGATNNPTVNLNGHLTNDGTLSAGTGTWTFNGSTAQTISGSAAETTVARLTLNNAAGLTISHSVTATTTLTLTSGKLTTSGAGVEVIAGGSSCATSVTRTSGYVAGVLRKTVPTGSPTCTYEIGDAATYRPLSLSFATVTSAFGVSAGISQAAANHPQVSGSGINGSKNVNRWWSLASYGGSPFASYSTTLPFLAGDIDAGAVTANFIAARYSASTWSRPTVGTKTSTSTQLTGLTGFGDFTVGEPGLDHYEIALATSSLACLASTVTVTACADSSNPCTLPAASVSGETATLATTAGTLGSTTPTFNGSGVATTTLSHAGAADGASVTVTLSGESVGAGNPRKCCPPGGPCTTSNSCTTTFNTAAFIIAGAAGGAATTIPTQTAGTTSSSYWLRAVKTNTTTKACESAITGSTTVNWAHQCNNPTTCSSGNRMTLTGSSGVAIAANPNSGVTASTAVTMVFDADGNAPFTFNYADVGQVTLSASKAPSGALLTTLSAATNAFVVKPGGFTLSSIRCTTYAAGSCATSAIASPGNNPAAANAAGTAFIPAGQPFSATVTAVTSTGAAAANYGRETSPEGVRLTAALVQPAGGSLPALTNASAFGSFSAGAATGTTFAWGEAGIITLTPSVGDGSYLGVGDVTGTASGNVGRFTAHRFSVAVAPACSAAFSYSGQPFSATVTALNSAGSTLANYGSATFAKAVTLSDAGALGSGSLTGSAVAAAAFTSGVAAATPTYTYTNKLTGQQTLALRATDTDGASSAGATEGSSVMRSGRLRLSNAFGRENAALQVAATAEYWSGSSWLPNSADSCTVIPAASVTLSNKRNGQGAATTAWSTTASAITLAGGNGVLTLTAPSPVGTGSIDIGVNLGSTATDLSCLANHPASTGAALPWLRSRYGSCAATWDRDPSALASFGIYAPETRKTVHVRELF